MGRIAAVDPIKTIQGANGPFSTIMFRVAVDRQLTKDQRDKVKNGDQSIVTCDFVPFKALGKTAEYVQQWCPKGKAVCIEATYSTYQTTNQQTGEKVYGHMFNVENIEWATQDSKNLQQNGGGNNNGGYQQNNNRSNNNNVANFDMFGDDNTFPDSAQPF